MRKAATITDPTALAFLEHLQLCELFIASLVRSANLLIKVDTMVPYENVFGFKAKPILYQRLVVAKYNHADKQFFFSLQGKETFTTITQENIQTYFGNANRVVIFEPSEVTRQRQDVHFTKNLTFYNTQKLLGMNSKTRKVFM